MATQPYSVRCLHCFWILLLSSQMPRLRGTRIRGLSPDRSHLRQNAGGGVGQTTCFQQVL